MATVIRTATELQAMSGDLAADYELGGNIDASETAAWNAGAGFIPIGDAATPFQGTFDGKGYTITGLTISRAATSYVGLFGYVLTDATYPGVQVKNVTLASVSIAGKDYTGGIIGAADTDGSEHAKLTLSGLHSSGSVSGEDYVGGVIGYLAGDWDYTTGSLCSDSSSSCSAAASATKAGGFAGVIEYLATERCYATGAASARNYAGGFAGDIVADPDTRIRRCGASGAVTVTNNYAGGFCGMLGGTGEATVVGLCEDCYAQGAVTGDASYDGASAYIGGFVGTLSYLEHLKRCYSTGAVAGTSVVGGFLGQDSDGVFDGCCWDTTTSGTATACGSGAVTGVTGYVTASMKLLATFAALLWGIGTVWNLSAACNSGYPCLIGVNPCCPMSAVGPGDVTVAKVKPSLELLRNLEMQCDGRFYVGKDGKAVYESRFTRHG